jgi:hypothetical protein
MFDTMPVFHFIPAQNFEHNKKDFACPLYKAAERKGVLTTTCASSNYILDLDIPTSKTPFYWMRMGVARRCARWPIATCLRAPRLRCLFFADAVLSNAMECWNQKQNVYVFVR